MSDDHEVGYGKPLKHTRNTANALRLRQAQGDLVRGRDASRGGGARTVPLERRKEIIGVSGAHTRDSLVSRDHGADAQWP